ncbi:MAG: glycosyltransferase [Flavobacteriales bacterium]|nr:glycosyltransferase [Flavobacteriales bacterium]
MDLLSRAKGKYIALCEGDDHWIDPLKLQKQVDLLEADPKAVGCFTDVFNEKEGVRTPFFDGINYRIPQGITTERDLIYGSGIPTCSLVYRREAMLEVIEQLYHSLVGDTIIFLHLSSSGYFIYLSEFTAVRNVHPGGIFSMRKRSHQLKVRLTLLPIMNEMTEGRYADEIKRKIRNAQLELWQVALESGDRKLIQESWQAVMRDRSAAVWNRTTALRNWFKAYVPIVDDVFSMVRK